MCPGAFFFLELNSLRQKNMILEKDFIKAQKVKKTFYKP